MKLVLIITSFLSLKTASLQDTLAKKDIEMQGMEERYKKYIEKAKSVIKTLDPKQNPNAAPEMSALRNQLGEKDRLIETLEQVTIDTQLSYSLSIQNQINLIRNN